MKKSIRNIIYLSVCKFLSKPKQPMCKDKSVGIVSLLCHRDVTKYIYTITSFFYQLGFQLPLFIVDDGTLTDSDKDNLHHRFNINIEDKYELDEKIAHIYHPYTFLYRNRFFSYSYIYKLKIDALVLSPFQRTILLDSDVLFFHKPEAIIEWIESKSDIVLHFIHERKMIHKGIPISQLERTSRILLKKYVYPKMNVDFNSGLVCIPNPSIANLHLLNSAFKNYFSLEIEEDLILTEEITMSIACGTYPKNRGLDAAKYIVTSLGIDYSPHYLKSAVCIHYAGLTSERFYKDALINTYKRILAVSKHT